MSSIVKHHVAHHFYDGHQESSSAKLGMWLFLCTEVLMFSGLFLAYFIIRTLYPEMLLAAGEQLNKTAGGINSPVDCVATVICSSCR